MVFGAYALGMGLVVSAVSVAVALARTSLVTRIRRLGPRISQAGGALLVIAGSYVAHYGWWEIRVLSGGSLDDPVIGAAEQVQHSLANGLDRLGFGGALAVVTLLAGGLATGLVHRSRSIRNHAEGSASRPPTTATRSGPTTSGAAKMSGK